MELLDGEASECPHRMAQGNVIRLKFDARQRPALD
jgi:hypothetical protein